MSGTGFRWVGHRKVDYTKPCNCEGEGCKRCMSIGYLFTDNLVKAYIWRSTPGVEFYTTAGRITSEIRNIVLQSDRTVSKFDFVLTLSLDDSGHPVQPFQIERMYLLQNVIAMRGDDSVRKFWSCKAEERSLTDGRPPTNKPEL